jgi:hypothetical protein
MYENFSFLSCLVPDAEEGESHVPHAYSPFYLLTFVLSAFRFVVNKVVLSQTLRRRF